MANLLLFNFAWDDARKQYQRALEIDPNNATAHQWAGDVMYVIGRPREGLADMRRAVELDPSSPIIHSDLGYLLLILRQYAGSRMEFAKSMEMDSSLAKGNLANLFYNEGKYDSIPDQQSPAAILFRFAALRKTGATAHAALLQDSISAILRSPHVDEDGTGKAMFFAITENSDSAFYWLNHMVDAKAGILFSSGVPCHDLFDKLKQDPRWDALLKRINAGRCQR